MVPSVRGDAVKVVRGGTLDAPVDEVHSRAPNTNDKDHVTDYLRCADKVVRGWTLDAPVDENIAECPTNDKDYTTLLDAKDWKNNSRGRTLDAPVDESYKAERGTNDKDENIFLD